ncbi:chromate transporter [Fodinisporobacter ferrooxydans]|uniref:Chromate transporter n=1 Tax=Fodinisporobacter ferrooxydans TaxID=2901836 RepID=A0ABY4CRJ3_9BACL|nr:chromate transporter [Alicyclobacillaceae bacterium MYW30-H2]
MIYLQIFWAFFIPNILGYGGGPSLIPLIREQIVDHYHWMTLKQFGETLAIANALPSPFNTKMAGYIGYQLAGIAGALAAEVATILPSAIAMIVLLRFMSVFRTAPQVKAMTFSIRHIVAVLLGVLAYQFFADSVKGIGWMHSIILGVAAYLLLERFKIHPAIVIAGTMIYGAVII